MRKTVEGDRRGETRTFLNREDIPKSGSGGIKKNMKEYENQGITYSEYVSIHAFINSNYHKTGICQTCGNHPKKTQWALKAGHLYRKDINSFIELCISCHRIQDFTEDHRERLSKRMTQGFKSGKYKPRLPKYSSENHPTNKPVIQLDPKTLKIITEFRSLEEAASKFNGYSSNIANQLAGKSKTAYGYKWKYKELAGMQG